MLGFGPLSTICGFVYIKNEKPSNVPDINQDMPDRTWYTKAWHLISPAFSHQRVTDSSSLLLHSPHPHRPGDSFNLNLWHHLLTARYILGHSAIGVSPSGKHFGTSLPCVKFAVVVTSMVLGIQRHTQRKTHRGETQPYRDSMGLSVSSRQIYPKQPIGI